MGYLGSPNMGVPRASGYGLNHIDGRLDHQSIHGIWGSILGPLLGQPLGQLAQPLGLGSQLLGIGYTHRMAYGPSHTTRARVMCARARARAPAE